MNTERRIRRLRRLKWGILVLLTLFLTTIEFYYYFTQRAPLAKGLVALAIGMTGATAVIEVGFRIVESLHHSFQREITERRQVEETLQERTQLLERTFASLREAVFIIDASTTKIADCNPTAAEMFGYSRQEILGQTTAFLYVDEPAMAEFREHLHSAVAEKGFLFLPEFKMQRQDGTIFPTEHNAWSKYHTTSPRSNRRRRRFGKAERDCSSKNGWRPSVN